MKPTTTLAALTLALSLASFARAGGADDHVARATRLYNLQDWPNALAEYKAAYAIDPKPELLWSIAQVQRLSGDCRSAIFSYEAFARGASERGANAAQELIAQCQATLDEQKRLALAATAPPPPPRVVRVAPQPVVHAAHEKSHPWILDPLGDVLAALAVGGLATGAAFLTVGNVAMNDASSAASYQAYDRAVALARTQQAIGVGTALGGLALAGLAVWRFAALAGRAKHEATALGLAPLPGGAIGTLGVRF